MYTFLNSTGAECTPHSLQVLVAIWMPHNLGSCHDGTTDNRKSKSAVVLIVASSDMMCTASFVKTHHIQSGTISISFTGEYNKNMICFFPTEPISYMKYVDCRN